MKINPAVAYHTYNKVAEYTHASRQSELSLEASAAQKIENTDQIQISAEGTRKMEIDQVSRSILSQMREPASAERLEKLRAAVQNGSYHIPTSDLVDAVMQHWMIA